MGTGEGQPGAVTEAQKKKLSGKKLVLFILLPVLLLGCSGAAAYFLLLREGPPEEQTATLGNEHADESPGVPHAYLPLKTPLQVNLVGTGKRMPYLSLDLWLTVKDEEEARKLEAVMPKVIDQFQIYLRSLRIEDLQGADGAQRMRDELLMRANAAAKPIFVEDVLIKSMLAQ